MNYIGSLFAQTKYGSFNVIPQLTVNLFKNRLDGFVTNYGFKFEIALLVREVDEVSFI